MSETSTPDTRALQDATAMIGLLSSGTTLADLHGVSERRLEALYAVGHALFSQGKYADAAPVFGFCVTHQHLDRRFHKAFGACLQKLGRHADALKYYGVASMLDLTDPDPVVHTAECLLALSREQEAARALRFALGQIKGEAKHAALGERVKGLLELVARKGDSVRAPLPPSIQSSPA